MPRALIATLLLSVAVAAMAQQAEIRYDSDYAPHPHHRYPPRHYRKLTLWSGELPGGFVAGVGNNTGPIGSTGVWQYKLACGSPSGPVYGECAETGVYLVDPATLNKTGVHQKMNWQFSCDITEPCEDIGIGMLNGIGLGPAGDWTGQWPVAWNIVGGTGDFMWVTGGVVTYNGFQADLILFY